MRTPAAAVSPFLALSALLLLLVATSVAANGYGGGGDGASLPGAGNGGYGGGDIPAGANGYGGNDDASSGPKGDGEKENVYHVPAYEKPVEGLDAKFYNKSCPDMEGIVQRAVRKAVDADYTLAASLIRLFFHDFAVEGTDASILIDVPGQSEKYADASKTLRGFDLIEEIKKEMESKCHAIVSCADILTAAARDAAVAAGVPYWPLKYGRRDGRDSIAGEADRRVPMGGQKVTELVTFFESNGLNILDLVVLSGAHTIGRSHCSSFVPDRIAVPSDINAGFANMLRGRCPANPTSANDPTVNQDFVTPNALDNQYYRNVLAHKVLFTSDAALLTTPATAKMVLDNANVAGLWEGKFKKAFVKMSQIEVKTGNQGEIRKNCRVVN